MSATVGKELIELVNIYEADRRFCDKELNLASERYFSAVLCGCNLVESMLQSYLFQKEGETGEHQVKLGRHRSIAELLKTTSVELPKEILSFLEVIRIKRNEVNHGMEVSHIDFALYTQAIDYVVYWLLNNGDFTFTTVAFFKAVEPLCQRIKALCERDDIPFDPHISSRALAKQKELDKKIDSNQKLLDELQKELLHLNTDVNTPKSNQNNLSTANNPIAYECSQNSGGKTPLILVAPIAIVTAVSIYAGTNETMLFLELIPFAVIFYVLYEKFTNKKQTAKLEPAETSKLKREDIVKATRIAKEQEIAQLQDTNEKLKLYRSRAYDTYNYTKDSRAFFQDASISREDASTDKEDQASMARLEEILAAIKGVEKKVDNLTDMLQILTERIGCYQSLMDKQLAIVEQEQDREKILSAFVDECVERIVSNLRGKFDARDYQTHEDKVRSKMGTLAWDRLDKDSRNYLVTANMLYEKMDDLGTVIDYSGVCLLLAKAVERVLIHNFYRGFIDFLNSNYPNRLNTEKYPSKLLDAKHNLIRPTRFSLGLLTYLLCVTRDEKLTEEQYILDQEKVRDYCLRKLYQGKQELEIKSILQDLSDNVEQIRKRYRNPAAHTNSVNKELAEDCKNYILDVEKVLKGILESFS